MAEINKLPVGQVLDKLLAPMYQNRRSNGSTRKLRFLNKRYSA